MKLKTVKKFFFFYVLLTATSLSFDIDLQDIDQSSFKHFTTYANSKYK